MSLMEPESKPAKLPDPLLDAKFLRAFEYALDRHRTQTRKGKNVPYIEHLMGVCSIVLHYGGDEDQAIAALLHDVVEDQGGAPMLEEIRNEFGARVALIVAGCTDSYTDPKLDWEKRKADYLRHLPGATDDVRLVSAADKLHNARAILDDYRQIGDNVWQRFEGKRDRTLWYYREVVRVLRAAGSNPLLEELDRVVTQLETEVGQRA